jgi:hypothetical protein
VADRYNSSTRETADAKDARRPFGELLAEGSRDKSDAWRPGTEMRRIEEREQRSCSCSEERVI